MRSKQSWKQTLRASAIFCIALFSAASIKAQMQSPKELVDAINRITDSMNFLAQEVIDVRYRIDVARARVSEQKWQAIKDRLTKVARALERIGNDPNDPALKDLPSE